MAVDVDGGSRASFDVALGDLDGDGDLDALIANSVGGGAQANQILVNDGDGSFSASDIAGDNSSRAIAIGDLDGDGGGVLPPNPAMPGGAGLASLVVEPAPAVEVV